MNGAIKRLRPTVANVPCGSSSTRQASPLHVGLPSDRCRLVATTTEVKGHTEPPSFLAVTAELASIADAGEAWRGPRRSATSPRRQVAPQRPDATAAGGG